MADTHSVVKEADSEIPSILQRKRPTACLGELLSQRRAEWRTSPGGVPALRCTAVSDHYDETPLEAATTSTGNGRQGVAGDEGVALTVEPFFRSVSRAGGWGVRKYVYDCQGHWTRVPATPGLDTSSARSVFGSYLRGKVQWHEEFAVLLGWHGMRTNSPA